MLRRTRHNLRGFSLIEEAFLVAVAGTILGGIWSAVESVNRNKATMDANQHLMQTVQEIRQITIASNDILSAVTVWNNQHANNGKAKGKNKNNGNPWSGGVTLFRGNAVALGSDTNNAEFTVAYDNVPEDSCTGFVSQAIGGEAQSLGMKAIYIMSDAGIGKKFCFGKDNFCAGSEVQRTLTPEEVTPFCEFKTVTLMFTFSSY